MLKNDRFIDSLKDYDEVCWRNPDYLPNPQTPFDLSDIQDAADRLERFAPYIMKAFPETTKSHGIIESELKAIPQMLSALQQKESLDTAAKLYLKCDNALPISGSIKARGGIYEVLKFAETVALESGKLSLTDDYSRLADPEFIQLFSQYSVAVGSTGNLGLSIGIIGAKLGFHTTVHMSHDAKQWKKDLLRKRGVTVVEYAGDFSKAVAKGRQDAESDPMCHFVDDEGSTDLFFGYSVAALRLAKQFDQQGIHISKDNPLFVYLPCGVGGSPGGVAFGLHTVFKENVKVIFVEPTHAPAMLLGMYTHLNDQIAVNDIEIDGKTAADGLAVGKPSRLVGKIMKNILYAETTVDDDRLYEYLTMLADSEGVYLEPSSTAGFAAFVDVNRKLGDQEPSLKHGVHIVWGTGGNMVPPEEMQSYYQKGQSLLQR
ncbi:D-serine ammonia-lyase [Levilactobacillus acidifarinae]|uniref:Probable D-serine dehydratase n=1 Tax=Levilactobacillus acidifarinae DSM 19394 = JCM 15949 TaxID=1423715 RepID=A0A0R1LUW7_9LACO|nr:D-serine ammonia-lyase [Levilactobacillus acidifarinae]KRK96066.1 D-serine dehydratase [Levilactobacillus acidifarinae DSM 19394]GEO69660.1 putative D-serine dehydratase [Levilactobacillus acidifarinae]